MEGTPASVSRGVSLSQSSSPSRKQWRVVSEHPTRNVGNEELERSKLGQSDERTIYEQGQGINEVVDYCSIQMEGISSIDDGMLQQRIHNLARQREEMQQVEIELRAQLIAKTEIMEIQSSFDAQFKEQSDAVSRIQEQLREREQSIYELERKMEEKERELHAVRMDNEAAWAKEDLLREQNQEIANYRREHDSIEAERAHHRQQIHDLQEHIQDKERQLLELQDQHRVAQETILYKDEQIRDAQAWMGRVQEMDVLQSTTLQAELRERTEQYNHLWVGWQRQFAEMERLHMHAIQQLQLELAAVRGNSGTYNGESSISQNVSSDVSLIAPNSGNHVEANGGGTPNSISGGLANGNAENSQQYVSSGDSSSQINHAPSLSFTPSIIGMPSYLPPGQVSAMHPYVMHQQGAAQAVGSHVPQSHVGHFHSVPAMTSFQQWQNQQGVSDGLTNSSQNQYSLSQSEENSTRSENNYSYGFSINGQALHQDYLSNSLGQRVDPSSQIPSTEETQTLESVERSYFVEAEAQHSLQQISSQFHEALRLEPHNQTSDMKAHENNIGIVAGNESASQEVMNEQPSSTASPSPSDSSVQPLHVTDSSLNCVSEAGLSTEQTSNLSSGKVVLESALLDERALLASVVRTIPPGGKIRISSTLPNRLGKMLAPLHWHDYKKKYGKLDDFVASHPELFVIEGDYIQLREGAQGIIAATSAVAKVAAAAAASSPYLSFFPSVAVTPMADSGRLKKTPSLESKPVRNAINSSHLSAVHGHYSNGSTFIASGNLSNVKILSKSKDPLAVNGQPGNGPHSDGSSFADVQSKGFNHSRAGGSFISKPQGSHSHSHRTTAALPSRRLGWRNDQTTVDILVFGILIVAPMFLTEYKTTPISRYT